MAGTNSKLTRILISLAFIALGLDPVINAIRTLFDGGIESFLSFILSALLGVLMFVTGVLGLLKTKISVCRVLGVFICVLAGANFITGLLNSGFQTMMLVEAILGFVYFDCN